MKKFFRKLLKIAVTKLLVALTNILDQLTTLQQTQNRTRTPLVSQSQLIDQRRLEFLEMVATGNFPTDEDDSWLENPFPRECPPQLAAETLASRRGYCMYLFWKMGLDAEELAHGFYPLLSPASIQPEEKRPDVTGLVAVRTKDNYILWGWSFPVQTYEEAVLISLSRNAKAKPLIIHYDSDSEAMRIISPVGYAKEYTVI